MTCKQSIRSQVQYALLVSLLCQGSLLAEEVPQESAQEVQAIEVEPEFAPDSSPPPSPSKRGNDFQNWLFAAASIVTATLGILIVSFSQGSSVPPADRPL